MRTYAQRLAALKRTGRVVTLRTVCTNCGAERIRHLDVTRALSGCMCGQCRTEGYLRAAIGGKR